METERRTGQRVGFSRPIRVHMMAIDGTWRRECEIIDISETGTNVRVLGPLDGINLKEFFLLLSSTGLAYRRCELAWVNGDTIGAYFLGKEKKRERMNEVAN